MTREEIIDLIETALLDSTDIDCTYLSQSKYIASVLEDSGVVWTPEKNTTPWELLTPEQQSALKAANHGWEVKGVYEWFPSLHPSWLGNDIYRAKSAPTTPE